MVIASVVAIAIVIVIVVSMNFATSAVADVDCVAVDIVKLYASWALCVRHGNSYYDIPSNQKKKNEEPNPTMQTFKKEGRPKREEKGRCQIKTRTGTIESDRVYQNFNSPSCSSRIFFFFFGGIFSSLKHQCHPFSFCFFNDEKGFPLELVEGLMGRYVLSC